MDKIIDEIRFNDVECFAEEGKLGKPIFQKNLNRVCLILENPTPENPM